MVALRGCAGRVYCGCREIVKRLDMWGVDMLFVVRPTCNVVTVFCQQGQRQDETTSGCLFLQH